MRSLKSIWLLAIACFCTLFFAATVTSAHAQAPAPVGAPAIEIPSTGGVTANSIVQWLTPLLVPLIITGMKKVAPSLPSWSLPVLAPVLGVILEIINGYATNHSTNLVVAALLGLAGVGVREIKTNLIPPKETTDDGNMGGTLGTGGTS